MIPNTACGVPVVCSIGTVMSEIINLLFSSPHGEPLLTEEGEPRFSPAGGDPLLCSFKKHIKPLHCMSIDGAETNNRMCREEGRGALLNRGG